MRLASACRFSGVRLYGEALAGPRRFKGTAACKQPNTVGRLRRIRPRKKAEPACWGQSHQRMARRYGGRLKVFGLPNEPDFNTPCVGASVTFRGPVPAVPPAGAAPKLSLQPHPVPTATGAPHRRGTLESASSGKGTPPDARRGLTMPRRPVIACAARSPSRQRRFQNSHQLIDCCFRSRWPRRAWRHAGRHDVAVQFVHLRSRGSEFDIGIRVDE